MGTRSRIGIKNQDGTVTSVYCHWDGYLEHNGKILFGIYNTEEKIRELLSYGNISSLARYIGEKHDFNMKSPIWTTFYGRDRDEEDMEARIHPTVRDFLKHSEEYNYLFKDGQWVYRSYEGKRWIKLTERNTHSKIRL